MNEVKLIHKLAAAGRASHPPRFDPVEGVLREIRQRQARSLPYQALGVVSIAASIAAAVALGAFGLEAWLTLNDPLNEMLSLTYLVAS